MQAILCLTVFAAIASAYPVHGASSLQNSLYSSCVTLLACYLMRILTHEQALTPWHLAGLQVFLTNITVFTKHRLKCGCQPAQKPPAAVFPAFIMLAPPRCQHLINTPVGPAVLRAPCASTSSATAMIGSICQTSQLRWAPGVHSSTAL